MCSPFSFYPLPPLPAIGELEVSTQFASQILKDGLNN